MLEGGKKRQKRKKKKTGKEFSFFRKTWEKRNFQKIYFFIFFQDGKAFLGVKLFFWGHFPKGEWGGGGKTPIFWQKHKRLGKSKVLLRLFKKGFFNVEKNWVFIPGENFFFSRGPNQPKFVLLIPWVYGKNTGFHGVLLQRKYVCYGDHKFPKKFFSGGKFLTGFFKPPPIFEIFPPGVSIVCFPTFLYKKKFQTLWQLLYQGKGKGLFLLGYGFLELFGSVGQIKGKGDKGPFLGPRFFGAPPPPKRLFFFGIFRFVFPGGFLTFKEWGMGFHN